VSERGWRGQRQMAQTRLLACAASWAPGLGHFQLPEPEPSAGASWREIIGLGHIQLSVVPASSIDFNGLASCIDLSLRFRRIVI